ncbi:probable calcium-binding protein CML44 isoform X2 [Capsicum annuum]|uniref:probable calcium-binding protein CML44 isoform X2 n=1 Tax=Capsicum annuum TaxID=4072 RepID=UPI0007BF287B|nr:probable calcium-binding protein CML44 isoform X2 [Capsicum annuum]
MIVVFLSLFQPGSFILNFQAKEMIFDKLDEDGDGLVSLDELKGLLDKIGACTGLDELQSLVGKTSLDFIDFLFFYEAMLKKNYGEEIKEDSDVDNKLEDDLVEAFKVFDLNGDGFISCEELQKLLSRLGLWDEKEGSDCRNMIHMYDTNLDGVLDFEEFKNMMLLSNSEGIPNL